MRIIVSNISEERRVPNPDEEPVRVFSSKKEEEQELREPRQKKKNKRSSENSKERDEGYNSSDEYNKKVGNSFKKEEIKKIVKNIQNEQISFAKELKQKKGLLINEMGTDGNCLFRAIADQVYGDQEMHDQVRERCMNYIVAERDHYSQFITEDFNDYVERKRRDRTYGNNTEIQAMGEMYNRPIEIYTFDAKGLNVAPINLFHGQYQTDNPPIRLSYHQGNHYNSVIDPNSPAVGVGLGLPNFQPGLADKMQISKAIEESETSELDKALLDEFTKESEIDLAQKELEDTILLESEQQEIEQQILLQSRQEYLVQMYKQYNL